MLPLPPERYFPDTVTEVFELLAPFCGGDARIGRLMELCAGRVLLKAIQQGHDGRSLATDMQLSHIADWIKAAIVAGEPWIVKVDNLDRPKKLMKFSSIKAICAEADKAMLKAGQRLATISLVEGDEALFADLGDGYRLVRLLTPEALDRESGQMQHCIGNGGYDDLLTDASTVYLSLRDSMGKAHATLEVKGEEISQIQGKQNKPPADKYLDRLAPFIRCRSYHVSIPASYFGHVIDVNGDWHRITNLPDGLTVSGSLDLRGAAITVLPDGLTVCGSLFLTGTSIISLPAGLTVSQNLYLRDTDITILPDGLTVGKYLDLRGTNVAALPSSIADETIIDGPSRSTTAKSFRESSQNAHRT
jgi:hypothetical protein